ncbi:MAG: Trm112 family protein [Chloroflexota bacterium]|nr:Trm112 family protein [Chloroflexota bacterium]
MSANVNSIPQDLLEILVCPVDHGKVNLTGEELVCETCGRAYPVRDGIPVMLVDEARMPDHSSAPAEDTGRTPGAAESAE